MRALRLAMSSLAALFAGACDNVVIYYADQILPYSLGFVGANLTDGTLPVRFYGQPFPGGADPEEVAAAIALPGWFTPARLTTQPPRLPARDLKVVLVFNPAYKDANMEVTCQPGVTLATEPPGGKTLRIAANLCYEGKSISWLYAAGPAPASTQDPKFDRLMSQVMASLLPQRIPK